MSSKIAGNRPSPWSLAGRLTAWYSGTAFLLIIATVGFLYWALVETLEHEDDRHLLDKANLLAAAAKDSADDKGGMQAAVDRESGPGSNGQFLIRISTDNGALLAETRGMSEKLPRDQFSNPENGMAAVGREVQLPSGQRFHVIAIRTSTSPPRFIQVAMDRTAEEDLLFRYRLFAGAVCAVALVLCALIGFTLARRGLRPLRDITVAATRVRSSTLHERIDDAALPSELADLASTFNDMLGRLEGSFRRLEQFSADIAHELRTPVNNLRGEAEVALGRSRSPAEYQETMASSLEELNRLSQLIDSLLFLARADSPHMQVVRQRVNLATELATIREFYQAAATEAGILLRLDTLLPVEAEVDRTLLQRAIGNLLANALAHTPSGGTVSIGLTQSDGIGRIEVVDSGPGIAPIHLPHVFDRFYRADPARHTTTGSVGLGLALVKSIAELHGGQAGIESELGHGAKVWVTLPLAERSKA